MSEWKAGEPPEDGWYWTWDESNGLMCAYYGADHGWQFPGDPASYRPLDEGVLDLRWQGPLTPPSPPES